MSVSRRSVFLLSAGLLLVAAAVAIARLPGNDSKPQITISKAVTHVTTPVTKDGYVDYLGAINARLGKGVNAGNNANVEFWQASGPHPENVTMEPEFFQLMGMESPPEEGDYFVSISQYMRDIIKLDSPDPEWEKIFNQQDKAMSRPWQSKQYPRIAEWLAINEKALSVIVEGTKKSQYFSPLTIPDNTTGIEGTIVCVLLPGMQQTRSFARALTARAMLRTRKGETATAWEDLMACHRLGRLVGRGPTMVEALVGIAIDGMAVERVIAFLEYTKPDARQIAKYQQDLTALPPLPDMGEKIDLCERYTFLDISQNLAQYGPNGFDAMLGAGDGIERILSVIMFRTIDWDTAMRNGNQWYDRIAEASNHETRKDRKLALELVDADLEKLTKEITSPKQVARVLLGSSKSVGTVVGNVMICLLLPAISIAQDAEDRSHQQVHNLQVAFALAAYHSDHDAYPEKLKQLAPKYIKKVPGDIFSGKSLIYKPTETGYLLYSFGLNEKDDGGVSHGDTPSADDLRIRMPISYKRDEGSPGIQSP